LGGFKELDELLTVQGDFQVHSDIKGRLLNEFPKITDKGGKVFFGGNQSWFLDKIQRTGGCGPTAAANILAYLALYDPAMAQALGVDPDELRTQKGFLDFMDRVYQTVTPFEIKKTANRMKGLIPDFPDTIGLWPVSVFSDKVIQFADKNGISLTANKLTNLDIRNGRLVLNTIGRSAGLKFIENAIDKNLPIALHITFNKIKMTRVPDDHPYNIDRHWATITGYEKTAGDTILTVSSWGQEWTISYAGLSQSWRSPILAAGSGMVYFEAAVK